MAIETASKDPRPSGMGPRVTAIEAMTRAIKASFD